MAAVQQQMQQLYQLIQQQQTQIQQQAMSLAAGQSASSSAASHSSSRVKPPPMTRFTGTVGPEVDNFIRDLKIQYNVYGTREFPEHDIESRLRFAGAYMSGTAADWWDKEDKSVIVSWDKFVERLHSRFRPLQAADNALHRLRSLKQKGAVSSYCSLFLSLLTHIPDYPEKYQIFDFLAGLANADTRCRIQQDKLTTLREVMDMAVSMEQYSQQSRSHTTGQQFRGTFRQNGYSQPSSSSTSTSVAMDINNVNVDMDEYESGQNLSAVGYDNRQGDKSVAEMVNEAVEARLAALHHPASSSLSQGQSHRGQSSSDNNRHGGNKFSAEKERLYNEGKCFKCKKTGHQSRQCPQKDFQ